MQRMIKRYLLWIFYAVFLVIAIGQGGREPFFAAAGPAAGGKVILLVVYFAFLAYSLYATRRENFFRTLSTMNSLWWGRQVGMDLYISVFLSLALIYLVEGSLTVMLIWFVPVFVFANLAILPYIILNYGAIVASFPG